MAPCRPLRHLGATPPSSKTYDRTGERYKGKVPRLQVLIGSRRGLTKSIGISNTNNKGMTVSIISDTKVYGGHLIRFSHSSECTKTTMTAALYLPPNEASTPDSVPLLTYLSGITCTDENVCLKGGAFGALSKHGIAMLCPDTSPRGAGIEGEDASWDIRDAGTPLQS